MAILASGSITIVDLNDDKKLSIYLTSNHPKVQINNGDDLVPNWNTANLIVTPEISINEQSIPLTETGLALSWVKKHGSLEETDLDPLSENVSAGSLVVSANVLETIESRIVTYLCYIDYTDPETGLVFVDKAEIVFFLVVDPPKKSIVISGDNKFKYNSLGELTYPVSQEIQLSAHTTNVNINQWQYFNGTDFTAYPISTENPSNTEANIIIRPSHDIFYDGSALIRITTEDPSIIDLISVHKVYDGQETYSFNIDRHAIVIPTNTAGQLSAEYGIQINPIVTRGANSLIPTNVVLGTLPTGITHSIDPETKRITLTFASGSTLGETDLGTIEIEIFYSSFSNIQVFSWAKSKSGSDADLTDHINAIDPHPQYGPYVHNQISSSSTWTVTHDRGSKPSVTVIDSGGNHVYGDVEYISQNQLVLTFSSSFSGTAYII